MIYNHTMTEQTTKTTLREMTLMMQVEELQLENARLLDRCASLRTSIEIIRGSIDLPQKPPVDEDPEGSAAHAD